MSLPKIIPPEAQLTMHCPSCKQTWRYTKVDDTYPHLYCSRCWNIYLEPRAKVRASRVWWQRLARREQHDIQGHAPTCECGGLFLFNAAPHCPHCRYSLPVPLPLEPKARLRHPELFVFSGSKIYSDNGTVETHAF